MRETKTPVEKPVILIVDDNPGNLQLLGSLLSLNHFDVVAAIDGVQALEFVEKTTPDIILLDMIMPNLSGLDVCKRLKSNPSLSEIPVIFITALNEVEDKINAFAAGGADFITKPIVEEEVIARIRVHLENSRLLKQLKETNEYLKDINALKDKFLGIAAHDIRSPLAGISGLLETIIEGGIGEINPQQREMLTLAFNSSKQVFNIVGDLLDISVIESGNLSLNYEPASLTQIVEERVRFHQYSIKKKNIAIQTHLKETPPILIDKGRIEQVLDNLLSNAAKFSPENSEIHVSVTLTEKTIEFGVQDKGPGLSQHDQEKLFGIFRKLSAKPTSGEKSSGLGLAICKKIIDAHKGTIQVTSSPGDGATFTVSLPVSI